MDDPVVFNHFIISTLGVTSQRVIDLIMNFVGSFGDLIAVNDVNIDTFYKYTHSENNARAAAQRILISNNITQGLKYNFFKDKW